MKRTTHPAQAGQGLTALLVPTAAAALLVGSLVGWRLLDQSGAPQYVAAAREDLASAERQLAQHPEDVDALKRRLDALRMLERDAKRLEILDELARGAEPQAWVEAYRAVTLIDLERERDAAAACERALDLDPHSADGLAVRGWMYERQGLLDEAIEAYDLALASAPSDPFTLIGRGACARMLDRAEEGLPFLDQAVMLEPSDPEAHFERGRCLEDLGRLQRAEVAYERATELDPDHEPAWMRLAAVRDVIAAGAIFEDIVDVIEEVTR